jgi:gamma-glutamyl:cysteine ligase YbdK (ATP-grasp superfamily)
LFRTPACVSYTCTHFITLLQENAHVDLGEVSYDPATEKPIDYHDISDITTATVDSTVMGISDEVSVHSADKYLTTDTDTNDYSSCDNNGDTTMIDDEDTTVYGVDDMTEDTLKQVYIARTIDRCVYNHNTFF